MTDRFVLYKYDSCPFCAMVRRFLDSKGVTLPMRDTLQDPSARAELIDGGGRGTVPCLRIEEGNGSYTWMYESMDIIRYLDAQLGQQVS